MVGLLGGTPQRERVTISSLLSSTQMLIFTAGIDREPQAGVVGQVCPL